MKNNINIEENWSDFSKTIQTTAGKICDLNTIHPNNRKTTFRNSERKNEVKENKRAWEKYIQTQEELDKIEYDMRKRQLRN